MKNMNNILEAENDSIKCIYIYGNHPNSEITYFAYRNNPVFKKHFQGFIVPKYVDDVTGEIYGKNSYSLDELPESQEDILVVSDRKIDELPTKIKTLFLTRDDVCAVRKQYAMQVVAELAKHKEFFLYGAGEYAHAIYRCLSLDNSTISVLITEEPAKGQNVFSAPVRSSKTTDIPRDKAIFIATDERQHLEIIKTLHAYNYSNYWPISAETAVLIYYKFLSKRFDSNLHTYRLHKVASGTAEFYITECCNQGSLPLIPRWRLRTNNIVFWEETEKFLLETNLASYYKEYYGPYKCIGNTSGKNHTAGNNVQIYMARSIHDIMIGQSDFPVWLTPVHAGAAFATTSLADVRDDEGDNISELNVFYSEMSVLYWVWKNIIPNVAEDIFLGLCHYRRHFDTGQLLLGKLQSEKVDIVLTCPEINVNGNIEYYFKNGAIKPPVMRLLLDILENSSPEYASSVRRILQCKMLHPFNMCIMKRNWLERYCRWVFDVCAQLHEKCLQQNLAEKRYLGFITELLLPAFCSHHKNDANIAIVDRLMQN